LKVTADFAGMELISNSSYYRRRDESGYSGTLYNLSYYQTLGWAGGETAPPYGTIPAAGSGPYGGSFPCTPQGFSCYPMLDSNGVHLPAALANYRSPGSVTNNQDNLTQEIRLQSNDPNARIVWTVGAFYSLNRTYSLEEIHDPMVDQFFNYVYGTTIAALYGTPMNPDGSTYLPRGDAYLNQLTGFDRQLAAFGEVVWSLTDTLKLTTGIRWSKTDYAFNSYNDGPQNGGAVVNGGPINDDGTTNPDGQQHEKPVTERVSLSWQMDPNNLLYATYSTGFRIGGANSIIPADLCSVDFGNFGIADNPASYKSDKVKNYEVGSKNNIGGRLRLATSAYYIKWDNIQQTILLPTCALTYTANVGTAVSKGFDLQADIVVTDHLSLESAIGYNTAYYTKNAFPGPDSTTPLVSQGDAIVGESGTPGAPWTITLGAEYRFNLLERSSYVRLDYEHQTKNNRPMASEDPNTVQFGACSTAAGAVVPCQYTPPATTFVSLRAGQEFKGWNISAFVDNLLDTHVVTNLNYQGVDGFGPLIPGPNGTSAPVATPLYRYLTYRPRTIGITATYRY
jgi:iron complex outermembrane recepter protein